jgi:hypothetical protein
MNFTTVELATFLMAGLILVMVGTFLVFGEVGCGIEAILFGSTMVATAMKEWKKSRE